MGKSENVFVFEGTEKTCKDMPYLSLAIKQSRKMQDIFWGRHPIPHAKVCDGTPAQIIVSRKRTLEAAKAYTGKKVCVLNSRLQPIRAAALLVDHRRRKRRFAGAPRCILA